MYVTQIQSVQIMQEIQDISEKHAQRGLNDSKKQLENEIDEFEFS